MNPKVSVVIPTYNRADKVRKRCRERLGTDVSWIWKSSSWMMDLLMRRGKHLSMLLVIASATTSKPIKGSAWRGTRESRKQRGEWIAFLDSDDLWEKEKLESQFNALERFGPQCGACYTDVRFFNHSETRTMFQLAQENYRHDDAMGVNSDVLRLLVRPGGAGMVVCLSSFLARRDAIKKMGGFDPNLLYSQDSEFMFRLAMLTGFCYVNRPLVLFDRSPVENRHVGVSSAWNRLDFFLQDSQLRLEGLLRVTEGQPAAVRNLVRQQLGGIHSGWVNCYLGNRTSTERHA